MNIVAALLIFTIIVVVHEFGHFLLAKKNGINVTEFSVGMGPRLITFAKTEKGMVCKLLCSQKIFEEREDWKDVTRYSWKLFPIGGSCAMVGEDMEDMSEGSFNSKGVWARFSVIFAGPFFNFILAFIFAVIIIGNTGVDIPEVVRVYANQPGEAAGLQEGDIIESINGKHISIARELTTYQQFHPFTGEDVEIVVDRDGEKKTITLNPSYSTYLFGFNYNSSEKSPAEVASVSQNGAFDKAGIREGDIIVKINDIDIADGLQLGEVSDQVKQDGKAVDFTISRDGKEMEFTVTPEPYEGQTLGVYAARYEKMGAAGVIKYSFVEVKYWIETTLGSLKQMIMGKVSRNDISGVVGIVDTVGGVIDQSVSYGWRVVALNLLYMSVLLSANLGVMNLLPLPALDGGRLVFILLEAVRGKPVDRDKEGFVHLIGFFLLMILMVFLMFNDIWKIVH